MPIYQTALYILAIIASSACTFFLYRGYRRRKVRMLMWSAICFAGLTLNNILLFADRVVFSQVDLREPRLLASLAALLFLLYGFILDSE
jgi:hypothetical protein